MTAKLNKPKGKGGRPSTYTPELGVRICKTIATSLEGLQKLCDKHDFFPDNKTTVYGWRYDFPEFCTLFAKAKQEQAELIAFELREIAYNRELDMLPGKDGPVGMAVNVARDRLIIDTEKWIACKLLPKVYGDKPPAEDAAPFTDAEKTELKNMMAEFAVKHDKEY